LEPENVNNNDIILTSGIFSIISLILSFLLFTIPEMGFKQSIAILMLLVTATALLLIQKQSMLLHNSFNFSSFKALLILDSVAIIFFIMVNNDTVITLIPKLVYSAYFFTLCFSSTQIIFLLLDILDAKFNRWINHRMGRRRFERTNESEYPQVEVAEKMTLVDKWRIATALTFHSITKKYVSPSAPIVLCPHCSFLIDFNQRVEWLGPSALKCGNCNKVVEIVDLLDDD
jgi:small-conductance mechanosensitive channel